MVYYIENKSTDPYYNLALEQVVFDKLDREHSYFMLWQNHNAIIIGKHQNTLEEIDSSFLKENNISLVRRLSGGGAVYHDLGNINFTFIVPAVNTQSIDFSLFCEPISKVLLSLGVPVEISGRNDMHVEGKKFSGNAQYVKEGRVMHHGTILYDSNLEILAKALKPGNEKIESKAVKSIRSRVSNIRPYMNIDMSIEDFWVILKTNLTLAFNMQDFTLEPEHHATAIDLKEKVYSQWNWNYGNSPPHTIYKTRRFDKCGKIEVFLDMGKQGFIRKITFHGDFFGNWDLTELETMLAGKKLTCDDLKPLLQDLDISQYFHALDTGSFLSLLLD